jgi:acetylornithine/succinyldiaminopimelate/putrescine aminotransferase
MKRKFRFVDAVRGKGLILGMELKIEDGRPIVIEMMKRGFLINCTMGNVLRFLPPLIVTKKEIDQMLKALEEVFKKIT